VETASELEPQANLLVDRIYAELQERIVSGALPAGERLREAQIAELLQVSRVPIREALHRLEFDGLVEILPRRGATVRQLTIKDVQELFDVRESLEVLVARSAARNATPDDVALLEAALDDSDRAYRTGDQRAIAAANAHFHEVVLLVSGNTLLQSLMRLVSGRLLWLFRLTAFRADHGQRPEHQALFEAIRDGQEDIAAALAYTHVARGRGPSIDALRLVLDGDEDSSPPSVLKPRLS
jgi:DNA-binding GntR family transcriptional regulator